VRVAIAGLGGAGTRGHLPALAQLRDDVTVVGAADPDVGRRLEIEARRPEMPCFASAEEMLASIACDLLVVATEPNSHAALVTLGMGHGLDVVCEKPLTVSRAHHDNVARACARHPDLALIPVHQYRYSPPWRVISRVARRASRLHRPFSLSIDILRPGTDPRAFSPWREDVAATGGMLADAAVHFIALAWAVDQGLELLAASRELDRTGHERSAAILRIGSGTLTLRVSNGAASRRTQLEFRLERASVVWRDDCASLRIGRRTLRRRVAALSDRQHVDALYVPMYRNLIARRGQAGWRTRRTAEALDVGDTLITLLERSPIEAPEVT
jgi:predicted dehydrogenase